MICILLQTIVVGIFYNSALFISTGYKDAMFCNNAVISKVLYSICLNVWPHCLNDSLIESLYNITLVTQCDVFVMV